MDSDVMMLLAAVFLLVLVALTIFGLFVYSGLFSEVIVKTCKPPFRNLEVAYKYSTGPYKGSSYLYTEVHALASSQKNFGIFYDDPTKVEQQNLKYIVGAVLSDGINNDEDASKEVRDKLIEHGYTIKIFPDVDNVVMTTFPFTSMVSVMIGISKVYPKLREYIDEHKLCAFPAIELYGTEDIVFCMPLSKQEEFFVEETKDEEDQEYSDNECLSHSSSDCNKKENDSQHTDADPDPDPLVSSSNVKKGSDQNEQGPSRSSSTTSSFEEIDHDISE